MAEIVTLTPNPAIDLSTSVDRIVPMRKLRCAPPRRDPGGGGVNVARVVKRFGGDVEASRRSGASLKKIGGEERKMPAQRVRRDVRIVGGKTQRGDQKDAEAHEVPL